MSGQLSEASGIHRSDLLHEHPGDLSGDFGFGTKRGWSGVSGGGSDDDYRPWEELVGLDDDAVSVAALLVPATAGQSKAVGVTSEHEVFPSAWRRPASRPGLVRRLRGRRLQPQAPCCAADDE